MLRPKLAERNFSYPPGTRLQIVESGTLMLPWGRTMLAFRALRVRGCETLESEQGFRREVSQGQPRSIVDDEMMR